MEQSLVSRDRDVRVGIVGAGNLASVLAVALRESAYNICSVYSRTRGRAEALATQVGAVALSGEEEYVACADIAIVAVPDAAILPIMESLDGKVKLVVHTSGATPLPTLCCARAGVLYPLQTFTSGRETNLEDVPIFYEGDSNMAEDTLNALASSLSGRKYRVEARGRLLLHTLGVLCNNYTNLLLILAEELMKTEGFDFTFLAPLLQETVAKALSMQPSRAQTGPALRGDRDTLLRHTELLAELHPEILPLYNLMGQMIAARRDELRSPHPVNCM